MRSSSKRDFDTGGSGGCGSARSSKKKVEFKPQLVDPRPERQVPCPLSMMDDDADANGDYTPVDDSSSVYSRFKSYRRGCSCNRIARQVVRRVVRSLCAAYLFVTRRGDEIHSD
jgi:hypothetical protein